MIWDRPSQVTESVGEAVCGNERGGEARKSNIGGRHARAQAVRQGLTIKAGLRVRASADLRLGCVAIGVVDPLRHRAIFSRELVDVTRTRAGDRGAMVGQRARPALRPAATSHTVSREIADPLLSNQKNPVAKRRRGAGQSGHHPQLLRGHRRPCRSDVDDAGRCRTQYDSTGHVDWRRH